MHIFTITGTTGTFVYMEVAICTWAAAKELIISLKFYSFLMSFRLKIINDVLSDIWCEFVLNGCGMFIAGRACGSVRYCTSITTYSVTEFYDYYLKMTSRWPCMVSLTIQSENMILHYLNTSQKLHYITLIFALWFLRWSLGYRLYYQGNKQIL